MALPASFSGPSTNQEYPNPPMSAAYPPTMSSRWPTERRPGPNRPHSLSVSVLADTHENYAKRQKLSQEYSQFPPRPTSTIFAHTPLTAMYPPTPQESRRSPSPSPYQGFAPLPSERRSSSWEWSHAQGDSRHPHHQHMHHGAARHHHPYGYSMDNMTSNSARMVPKQNGRHQRKRSAGCLNCHTVWSPTWRKDGLGNMRCNACGLYLAARGQERPLTLVPKKKGENGEVGHPDMLSPLPRDSPHAYPHPGYPMERDDSYPFPPYYQHPEQHHFKPSPSFSHQSLAISPGASSTFSTHTPDLLSPAHSRGHLSSSPNSSPFSFGDLTLVDQNRRLPPPPETPNCLGLNGVSSRPSSADVSPPRFFSDRHGRKPAPLNLSSPSKPLNEMTALSPVNEVKMEETSATRQALPPLSELTRGISSWKPQMRAGRQNSVSIDRIQTEALDARLTRGDRPPSA